MVGLKRGFECFPNPVIADEDGFELLPYSPGQDEKCIGPDGNEVRHLNCFQPMRQVATDAIVRLAQESV